MYCLEKGSWEPDVAGRAGLEGSDSFFLYGGTADVGLLSFSVYNVAVKSFSIKFFIKI